MLEEIQRQWMLERLKKQNTYTANLKTKRIKSNQSYVNINPVYSINSSRQMRTSRSPNQSGIWLQINYRSNNNKKQISKTNWNWRKYDSEKRGQSIEKISLSIYEKNINNYSKFIEENKEDITWIGKNKENISPMSYWNNNNFANKIFNLSNSKSKSSLTPLPKLKRRNSLTIKGDSWYKAERSVVILRQLEYTRNQRWTKRLKDELLKIKFIQHQFRWYVKRRKYKTKIYKSRIASLINMLKATFQKAIFYTLYTNLLNCIRVKHDQWYTCKTAYNCEYYKAWPLYCEQNIPGRNGIKNFPRPSSEIENDHTWVEKYIKRNISRQLLNSFVIEQTNSIEIPNNSKLSKSWCMSESFGRRDYCKWIQKKTICKEWCFISNNKKNCLMRRFWNKLIQGMKLSNRMFVHNKKVTANNKEYLMSNNSFTVEDEVTETDINRIDMFNKNNYNWLIKKSLFVDNSEY